MKKNDILKYLEQFNDDDEINSIEGMELDSNNITLDKFKTILKDNKECNAYVSSMLDSKVSRSINTWKENNLAKLVNEEVEKRTNKNKSPEQIALEELQKKFDNLEQEKLTAEKRNNYTKILTSKNIDLKALDFIYADSEEEFNKNLETFQNLMDSSVQAEVNKRLDNSYVPPKNDNINGKITWEQVQANPSLFVEYQQQQQ